MAELPRATVIVCTRDRAAVLRTALQSLLALDYPADRWEILIVDNGSVDETPRIASELAAERPDRVRVVTEPRGGLSLSRNRGVREATGQVIAFADDDAYPDAGWLRALVAALERHDAMVAGGPVEPIFTGAVPEWCTPVFFPYFAVWDEGSEPHFLRYSNYPRGNNMALRREVFERFGYFSPHLGRTGTSLLSCEETELCLRVERGGGRIVYAPEARMRHLTPMERITPEWLARRFFAQARSEGILEWRHAGWRGLRSGWLRWYGMSRRGAARAAVSRADHVLAQCLRRGFLGHSIAVLTAPLTVPRYRPVEPTAAWRPRVG